MSLDNKPKGNPNWVKGKSGNPDGRPAGVKGIKSLLKVASKLADKKRHPVDELIRLADKAEQAASHVIITKSGGTSWRVGEIVDRGEFLDLNAKIKNGNFAESKNLPGGDSELAAKIWTDLLRYCEPQKKAVETAPEKPTTPEESKAAATAAMKYLQDLENGDSSSNAGTTGSETPGLGTGETQVPAEAGTEEDI